MSHDQIDIYEFLKNHSGIAFSAKEINKHTGISNPRKKIKRLKRTHPDVNIVKRISRKRGRLSDLYGVDVIKDYVVRMH